MRPKNELRLEECVIIARKNPFIQWLQITGGEPFVRPDIVEIARAFSKNLYILSIPTNSLCSFALMDKQLRGLKALKIPHFVLTVSLDGDRTLHDYIRGIRGNYDRAIRVFDLARSLGIRTVFGYTISKFNAGQFARVYQNVANEVEGLQVSDFHLNLAQYSANYYTNQNLYFDANPEAAVFDLIFYRAKLHGLNPLSIMDKQFSKGLLDFVSKNRVVKPSRALEASCFLDSFGVVYPSIMHDEKIGELRPNYLLADIWNNEAAQKFREKRPIEHFWTSCENYQTILGDLVHAIG